MSWSARSTHGPKHLLGMALLLLLTSSLGAATGAAGSQLTQTQGSFDAAGSQVLDGTGPTRAENARMGFTGAIGEKQSPGGQTDLLPASTVTVPEPGVALLQLCALASLGVLASLRGRLAPGNT